MHVILFLLAMFVPAVCFSQTLDIEKYEIRQEKAIIPLLIGAALVAVAVGIYTFLQMRKMQKKNQPKPNQLDGTIADEGTSFCDIAGSPHVHANITDIWGKSTQAIKKKSGGFLGIGKTSQVTGYRYYAKFAAFIGNRIEKLIAINFDNRKWVIHDPVHHPVNMLPVREGNLFGENEGGVAGDIDIHFGYPDQEPNLEYQKHFPLVSGYPYQSYLLFRGYNFQDPFLGHTFTTPAFYLGNSGYMKEMLLWVKRIHVKNDGGAQWYDNKSEIPDSFEIITTPNGEEFLPSFSGILPKKIDTKITSETLGNSEKTYTEEYIVDNSIKADEYRLVSEAIGVISINSYDLNATSSMNYALSGPFVVRLTANILILGESKSFRLFGKIIENKSYWIDGANLRLDVVLAAATEGPDAGKMGFYAEVVNVEPFPSGGGSGHALESNSTRIYVYPQNLVSGYSGDINPIHKIREILTDDTSMAKPGADVNDINFKKAADRIWDEMLGVSWAIDEKSCIDAIEELCYHIEAGIRVNRQTGLYEMVLFRDDWFAEDEIHTIAENKIKDLSLEVMNSDDIVNQLNVTYYDRERIKNSTFSVYENGSILTMGKANAESIEFPYFMKMRNAEIVANWKLKQYSTPAWKGTFTTGWREARKWNRYDLVKINWSKKWQGTILARIMKIDLGNGLNNEVVIDFEEVVPYSGEMNTSIVVDDSTEIKPMPPQSAIFKTFEIPYYDLAQLKTQAELDLELARNPNIGFVAAVAGRPQPNSINAQLHTESDVGYELVSNVEYASFARTDEAVNRTQQSFVVKNEDLSVRFRQDSLIMLGDEIMIYKSYDAETKTLTVERGALDTIPQNHIENTVLYFYDDAFAYDPEGYTPPKTVNATVLTTTPSGIESLETSPKRQVEIESRAIRPYPPANVKINGEYWQHVAQDNVELTWADRNRASAELLNWFDGAGSKEEGVTYHYQTVADDNSVIASANDVSSGVIIQQADFYPRARLQLWSERDGYESLQKVELYLESAIGLMTSFIEPIYGINEYVSVSARLSNNAVITSLTLESGTLPAGFSIVDSRLQGACTVAGVYTFTLKAIDAMSNEIHKTFTVKIQGALWSQLTFDDQNIIDRVSANSWTLGSGNTYTSDAFESSYALQTGGVSAPTCLGKGIIATQNGFSVSMRIKLTKPIVNYAPLWFMGDTASNAHRDSMYINSSHRLESYRQATTGTGKNTYGVTTLEIGRWYQVGYTFTGTGTGGGIMKIWLDGVLEMSDFYGAAVANFANLYLAVVRSGGNPIYRDGIIIDNFVVTIGAPRFE